MEDLSNIETVQDLLAAQTDEEIVEPDPTPKKKKLSKKQKIAKKIVSKIMDESPAVGLLVTQCILDNLAEFHRKVYKNLIEDGQGNEASTGQWAYDLAQLESALRLIEDVDLT